MLKAVANVNTTIRKELLSGSINILEQDTLDNFLIKLDGTKNKSKLGANAILGVSMLSTIVTSMKQVMRISKGIVGSVVQAHQHTFRIP